MHIPQTDELFADPLELYPKFVSIYTQNVCHNLGALLLCAGGARVKTAQLCKYKVSYEIGRWSLVRDMFVFTRLNFSRWLRSLWVCQQ